MAQDDYYGCASLLGHNNQKVDRSIFLKISIALSTPLRLPPPRPAPPSSNHTLTLVQPPLTPARAGTFPTPTPLRAARPPTVRGSLHYGAPCLEKGRARARASILRGHKGAKEGERRRPCWRAPARKLTRRDPS